MNRLRYIEPTAPETRWVGPRVGLSMLSRPTRPGNRIFLGQAAKAWHPARTLHEWPLSGRTGNTVGSSMTDTPMRSEAMTPDVEFCKNKSANLAIHRCLPYLSGIDAAAFRRNFRRYSDRNDEERFGHTFRELVVGVFVARQGYEPHYEPEM